MAKKSKTNNQLTADQYESLAKKLINTEGNVYFAARSSFDGYKWDDADFDRLKNLCGVFRCEECGQWQSAKEEECKQQKGYCHECVAAMNGDDFAD